MPEKLHIEALFTAMQNFCIGLNRLPSPRRVKEYEDRMDEIRAEFRKEIGPLAEHICWDDPREN